MTFNWQERENRNSVRNPFAEFRLNTLGPFFEGLERGDDKQSKKKKGPLDQVWWMVLLELAVGPDRKQTTLNDLVDKANSQKSIARSDLFVPLEYSDKDRNDPNLSFVTVFARRPYLNAINGAATDAEFGVRRIVLGRPLDDQTLSFDDDYAGTTQAIAASPIRVEPGTVVVAVIDTGIAIGHDLFRSTGADGMPDTSRVAFFWNMDGKPGGGQPATFGRKWSKLEIDVLLQNNLHAGLLDEPTFYRDLGLINWTRNRFAPSAMRISHGTHVMGLCAGFLPGDPDGLKRPIIAVQLPTPDVGNTGGSDLVTPLEQALTYIRKKHKKFRIDGTNDLPPLVVNFSFGNYAGPHDGTSVIERSIDKAMHENGGGQAVPRTALLPSGNANIKQCHAQFDLCQAHSTQAVDWHIQPGDNSPSVVQFWFQEKNPLPQNTVTLTVVPPGGIASQAIDCKVGQPGFPLKNPQGDEVACLVFSKPKAPTNRGLFQVLVSPTANIYTADGLAPSGPWRLILTIGPSQAEFIVKAWVERDETLPGYPEYGRQSYLSDPNYHRFNTGELGLSPFERPALTERLNYDVQNPGPVRRAGTLNGFACGKKPAVIAGYVRSDREMALYSSGGPTNTDDRIGADAAAVSDDSVALGGVLSAGSNSGSRVALRGTSVATPQVARWVADQMEAGQSSDRAAVFAQAQTDDPGASPPKPPETRTGGGRMDLPNHFGKLRWPGQ